MENDTPSVFEDPQSQAGPIPIFDFGRMGFSEPVMEASEAVLNDWLARHEIEDDYFESDLNLLYHFTDAAGLKGIVQSGSLWFSDVRYLNDMSEVSHGVGVVSEIVKKKIKRSSNIGQIQQMLEQVVDYLKPGTAQGFDIDFYTASFCTTGDLLSQWREYAGGAGYAVGLALRHNTTRVDDEDISVRRKNGLTSLSDISDQEGENIAQHRISNHWSPPFLRRIIYDPDKQRAIVEEVVDKFVRAANAQGGSFIKIGLALSLILYEFCISFKHPSFSEEKEWRLIIPVSTEHDTVSFRTGATTLIPFTERRLVDTSDYKFPFHHLVIGPMRHQEEAEESARLFLYKNGFDIYADTTSKSTIPMTTDR